ncbi:sugar ABC transporter ATP-binding protein [Mucilaginibacter sp. SMC90]|uniref:sugar ABC transporter ATP-binding protein n=1 Tax=Mucilaginibacter sp. SMC90 TaxID=2929803 RepID=UPI001FB4974B|nr:sugar ABC transporter ATP-binding protein [Mucilaginibacter sp. SMC90]UOE51033.1 sugar ABC transporter ATP-binding protein [Mucilaginibacter sp. SMC90]
MNTDLRLSLQDITREFPGVKALDAVSLDLYRGEVLALCGENGAGKSTLMNVLSGNLQPDKGHILLNGRQINITHPQQAFEHGIAIVYQHLSLIESLSIAENIYANQQPCNKAGFIDFKKLISNTAGLLKRLRIDLDPKVPVGRLSAAQKQMVEIAKALVKEPQIMILDEPTASLTERETAILFDIIAGLKAKGVSVIYISHRLDEIFSIADRVAVLKDGKMQGAFTRSELSRNQLIKLMVGREIRQIERQSFISKDVLLETVHLTGKGFTDIGFKLHGGEILGFAGLAGAGRTELARAIFGADEKKGVVRLKGTEVNISHPLGAIKHGIAYVPEDRKQLGLFLDMSVTDNIGCLLSCANNAWTFNRDEATKTAKKFIEKLHIVPANEKRKVLNLSGGNQQKVVLSKWLNTNPEIFIVDEPTHGIDVGAKFEIYSILASLAQEGKGVMIISSDIPELLGVCDRIIVLREGVIAGELLAGDASEEKILALAT